MCDKRTNPAAYSLGVEVRGTYLKKPQFCGLKTGKGEEKGSALEGGRKGPEQAFGFGD